MRPTTHPPLTATAMTDEHRRWLEQVEDRTVWWDPLLHPETSTTPAEGGFVRYVGGRPVPFADLSELVVLWQLRRGGFIEPVEVPIGPDAARQPRVVQVTTAGLHALRGTDNTRK